MSLPLDGRIALVTGGGRGIGRGCSLALAAAGAHVALTYRKDEDAARATAAEIVALGRKAFPVKCDVAVEADVEEATKKTIAEFGRIDILVANAGIASRGNTLETTSTDEMRRLLDTHVMGSFWCARAVLATMRAEGRGHVFFISSVATLGHAERTGPYTMAKSAIESMTKVLSKEVGPDGIRVNCVAPGLIETDMGKRLVKARTGEDIAALHAKYPFGRVGQPEDIANLIVFLASDAGSYISGQTVWVHGGGFERHEVL